MSPQSAAFRCLLIFALARSSTALVANLSSTGRSDCHLRGGPLPAEGFRRFASSSIVIPASAPAVWGVLTSFNTWKEWNDVFDAEMEGAPEVNKTFKIHATMRNAPFPLKKLSYNTEISVMEENQKLCLLPKMLWSAWTAEWCFVLCPTTLGSLAATEVHNFEDSKGLLRGVVGQLAPAIEAALTRFNAKLDVAAAAVPH